MHSADAVLLAAADAVANATMKLMNSDFDADQAQPQLRHIAGDGSQRCGRIHRTIGVFSSRDLVDVFWRRAISAGTRSHCRPECGIAPFRRGNAHKSSVVLCSFAVSAECIAIASSEFSGGAVISIDWFGEWRCRRINSALRSCRVRH